MKRGVRIVQILRNGGIGVLLTDTIYGIVGSALNEKVVARIYNVRKRTPTKPLIILISSIHDLGLFGITIDRAAEKILQKVWPGKVSVVLPCASKKFSYLHRGTGTCAFRLPAKKSLRALLQKTGPLVAPSANPEGLTPARTIKGARKYFGDKVDFYVSEGKKSSAPSTLITIKNGTITVLREGAVKIKDYL